jgi:hypothetical protein
MISHLDDNCPICGTKGKSWKQEDDVFECPKCFSVFSKFGIVAESQKELNDSWN